MNTIIEENKEKLGEKAAILGAAIIRRAITLHGKANIIVATGASQFEMLAELVKQDIDWSKIVAFHLDEYINIDKDHPASFRKYLKERFVDLIPIKEFHYINPGDDPQKECDRLNKIIIDYPIDIAFVGIGENGHLAFNDPPADFKTEIPYIIVDLDKACREQQLGEGWFKSLDEVPQQAISMSISQILKSEAIICSVPDRRKAKAVKYTIEGEINADVPASILQIHENCYVFLDSGSAGLLSK